MLGKISIRNTSNCGFWTFRWPPWCATKITNQYSVTRQVSTYTFKKLLAFILNSLSKIYFTWIMLPFYKWHIFFLNVALYDLKFEFWNNVSDFNLGIPGAHGLILAWRRHPSLPASSAWPALSHPRRVEPSNAGLPQRSVLSRAEVGLFECPAELCSIR